MKNNIILTCTCGKEYTEAEWDRLEYLGICSGLEYRNCTCHSTLAIQARYASDFTSEEKNTFACWNCDAKKTYGIKSSITGIIYCTYCLVAISFPGKDAA